MSGKGNSGQVSNARAAFFNPQHAAYSPSSQNAGSAMAARSQASMDARASAMNPQPAAFNPSFAKGAGKKK